MAITNLISNLAPLGLDDVGVHINGGALLDVMKVKKFTVKPVVQSAQAEGEGSVFAVHGKMKAVEVTFEHTVMAVSLYSQLIGGAAPVMSGTTPSLVATTGVAATVFPYFSLEAQCKSITGLDTLTASDAVPADAHIKLYKCKLLEAPEIGFNDGEYVGGSFKALAIVDPANSNKLFDIITNQTAAAIV